jgi:hypothetical protein
MVPPVEVRIERPLVQYTLRLVTREERFGALVPEQLEVRVSGLPVAV